jgi:hypothetical protein
MQVDWAQIIGALATAFAAGFGSGFAVRVVIDRSRTHKVIQKGNTAGGDIAGRDISKRQ